MANVVLVHGAWSDGSIWQEVVNALEHEGHLVLAVELPLTSLAADTAQALREIAALEGPVTLVGHSYGGFVISEAARENEQVVALVFVAAYVPDDTETVGGLSDLGVDTSGAGAIRFGAGGWSTLDRDLFGAALGPGLAATTVRALAAAQKPTHSACFTSPAGPGAWRDLPCAYIRSVDDRILDPDLQRWFAERAGATVTDLSTGHLSPVSRPADVAAAVSRAVGEADATRRAASKT